MIARALGFLASQATRFLAGGVLLGFAAPPLADALRPWLGPIIVVTLVLALIRLDYGEVRAHGRRPVLLLATMAALMLATPPLVWGLARLAGVPEGLTGGVVLMAASTPLSSMPAFAMILGLDAAFTLLAVIIGHAAVPLTLPPTSLWLLGLELPVGAATLAIRLFGVVGLSFALAWALRRWPASARVIARRRPQVDGLAVLSLVVFAIGIMSGVTEQAIARPGYVAYAVALAFIANAGLQALGALAFLWAGRRIAFTVGLMAGNRNMGLVLAALGLDAPPEIALFFAVAQLPMYMLPMLALPVYKRLMRQGAGHVPQRAPDRGHGGGA